MTVNKTWSLTERLGIRGMQASDPLILATLAGNLNTLLIGEHGSAKSLLCRLLALAMSFIFRHYLCPLLQWDDLIGIPWMPDEGGTELVFVTTRSGIWPAELILLDEPNRASPSVNAKLYTTINERSVLGIPLENLKVIFGAMQPASGPEADVNSTVLGIYEQDPALLDRWHFIVTVPSFLALSSEDMRAIARGGLGTARPEIGVQPWLQAAVAETRHRSSAVKLAFGDLIADYCVYLAQILGRADIILSGRRVKMITRNIMLVHAARQTLLGEDAADLSLEASFEQAMLASIPQMASENPPERSKLIAAHTQVFSTLRISEEDGWRQVLLQASDDVERVLLADRLELSDETLSILVTRAIGGEMSELRRQGLMFAMYLAYHQRRNLNATAWQPLADAARHVLEPRLVPLSQSDQTTLDNVLQWIEVQKYGDVRRNTLLRNFILAHIALLRQSNFASELDGFMQDMLRFSAWEGLLS